MSENNLGLKTSQKQQKQTNKQTKKTSTSIRQRRSSQMIVRFGSTDCFDESPPLQVYSLHKIIHYKTIRN